VGFLTMDTFTIHAEQVNVEEIIKEIHRRVLEKKQKGVYTDDELRHIAELKSDLSPKKNEQYAEMNLHLRRLHVNWDVAASQAIISSHRKVIGAALVAIKRIGFRALKFFGSAFFTRQTEFNAASVRFNTAVLDELNRLSEENKELRRVQQELVRQIEFLQTQIATD